VKKQTSKTDLNKLFLGLQEQLALALKVTRENIGHPTSKGDVSELTWLKMLADYLPSRYMVDSAFILDHQGSLSEQIDIVIFDRQYCPVLFKQGNNKYIPAESVYAILEVKQQFDKPNLEYASGKAASVRRLKRTSAKISGASGKIPAKKPFKVLSGILAYESSWNPGLGAPLLKILDSFPQIGQLDLGCSIMHGAFEANYNKSGSSRYKVCKQDTTLAFFFMRLVFRLQQLGNVPAIDIDKYTMSME